MGANSLHAGKYEEVTPVTVIFFLTPGCSLVLVRIICQLICLSDFWLQAFSIINLRDSLQWLLRGK